MMLLIFFLLFLSTGFAWYGKQKKAMTLYLFTLVLASFWFSHHVTSHLTIDL
jgi:Family of unknown function (DUF5993)